MALRKALTEVTRAVSSTSIIKATFSPARQYTTFPTHSVTKIILPKSKISKSIPKSEFAIDGSPQETAMLVQLNKPIEDSQSSIQSSRFSISGVSLFDVKQETEVKSFQDFGGELNHRF